MLCDCAQRYCASMIVFPVSKPSVEAEKSSGAYQGRSDLLCHSAIINSLSLPPHVTLTFVPYPIIYKTLSEYVLKHRGRIYRTFNFSFSSPKWSFLFKRKEGRNEKGREEGKKREGRNKQTKEGIKEPLFACTFN